MTIPSAIGSFALIAGLITIIPGVDTALVLRSALTRSRRHAFAAAAGVATGTCLWGAAAAAGVSAVLATSQVAYDVIRIAGAAYLTWLGLTLLWKARHPGEDTPETKVVQARIGRSWLQGLTSNLLNPKLGVFYMAMLPQFIPAHAPHLLMGVLLAAVHDVEGLAWFTFVIFAAHLASRWLRRDAAKRVMDRITGTVLVAFGVKLALSKR